MPEPRSRIKNPLGELVHTRALGYTDLLKGEVYMRTLLGLLSLLAFVAVLLVAFIFVSNPPADPLPSVLALAVFGGLVVVFRALRGRMS
jgi:hypothetical protein